MNEAPPRAFNAGIRLRCPHCGKGKLFRGVLTIADSCSSCGLSLKEHDIGDGPAFFGIVIVGFLVVPVAAIVEYKYAPSPFLSIPLWGGLVVGLSLVVLRAAKSLLFALHYRLHVKEKNDRV